MFWSQSASRSSWQLLSSSDARFFESYHAWLRLGGLDDCNRVIRKKDDTLLDEVAQEEESYAPEAGTGVLC